MGEEGKVVEGGIVGRSKAGNRNIKYLFVPNIYISLPVSLSVSVSLTLSLSLSLSLSL